MKTSLTHLSYFLYDSYLDRMDIYIIYKIGDRIKTEGETLAGYNNDCI